MREDYEVTWGHSEIRTYVRGDEIVNIQYQGDDVWSLIFGELPVNHETNSVSANAKLNTYSGVYGIDDIVRLCKWAYGIIIAQPEDIDTSDCKYRTGQTEMACRRKCSSCDQKYC